MLDLLYFEKYPLKKNVHSYRQGDLSIAHDVNSGSLHVLDEGTYNVLKAIEELQELSGSISIAGITQVLRQTGKTELGEELTEILEELEELRKEGTLFTAETEGIQPTYPAKPIVKAICLHVAHDCNLRCEYCFAGTGAFGGSRTMMDLETGKKGIDFVLESSGHRNHCEVDFFGGEPLLNFRLVKDLVEYGRKAGAERGKTIKFTLTTNGVLLNDKIQEFLEQEDISVVLSLDGRPEVHDRMRPYADGRGSYAKVTPLIKQFATQRPESSPYALGTYYYVRGTYTHFNLDFDQDVLHMADLGIKQISVEPVVAGPKDAYAFQEGDLDKIREAYDRLGEELILRRGQGRDFNFFHFNVALDQGPCMVKRLSGCGAGHEYVAISPEGDLYPCHQFVGQETYKLGSLYDETPLQLKEELVKDFRSAHVYAKPSCRECWARFACSGGCHAANVSFTQNLTEVYTLGCELQKKRLEVALYVKIKELMSWACQGDGPFDTL
ncbi:thioether cross-link-forming SCIFF peptide maturase [Desulfosporosinus sp.]|uniref:thioether cross-link-forming SCIFF peptide maturase n=1 Tax=Desulfosporosinus sp. TaxID=157907 RepID=UPI0025C513BF|nr:thioether cross-link-forming SCIFF peptide maturase [Desulfosporosinus sp.]MBC2722611.1 thioether cross-link-forming SCIFF peptide maturase [Desulfosporosinus sp.]MBC2727931.1 thioether cross-link-forming SCIFF peptide maturase [Desulfosporosinus sp.]